MKNNMLDIGCNILNGGNADNNGENNYQIIGGDAVDTGIGNGIIKGGDVENYYVNNNYIIGGISDNKGKNDSVMNGGDAFNYAVNNNGIIGKEVINKAGNTNRRGRKIIGRKTINGYANENKKFIGEQKVEALIGNINTMSGADYVSTYKSKPKIISTKVELVLNNSTLS
ncbi:hypothetical protein [Providencia manganoxydans]|uniref:hypothetical protein n=1 Tax=Providencia manganoxydans TaxID=2923283 RepID=UPI0032DBB93F